MKAKSVQDLHTTASRCPCLAGGPVQGVGHEHAYAAQNQGHDILDGEERVPSHKMQVVWAQEIVVVEW
jgi:hypothetical protein